MQEQQNDGRSEGPIGRAYLRPEDVAILRGEGRFFADIHATGSLEIHVLRSTQAHGRIVAIDAEAARRSPGVVAVLTGKDLEFADRRLPCIDMGPNGLDARQQVLPTERVRYIGEPVAVVVAENRYLAEDAGELVRISYEALAPATSAEAAIGDAPLLYPELGSNTVYTSRQTDGDADAAFATAAFVIAESFDFHRHFALPLETRGVMAEIDAERRLNVWSTTQIPYMARGAICGALGLPPSQVRVTAPRLGGGFGSKENVYPEEIIVPAVAMKLGRKVRWLEDRREHFTASVHAREETVQVEASVDSEGNITAIKLDCITDIGAAFTVVGNTVTTLMGAMIRGPYRVPSLDARMRSVVTNKVPLNVFRGAGHPQAVLIMETLLDIAAEKCGLDRAEIRRRNLLTPEELPLDRNASDCIGARRIVYDEGRYGTCFAMALEQADYANIAAARTDASARGKALGIGFSNHVEMTAIGPHEEARVTLGPQGKITVFSPIVPMGQGSEITQRQIVADELGIPIDQIEIRFGNTDDLTDAVGAFASRGAAIGGAVIRLGARALKDLIVDRYAQATNATREDLEWTGNGLTGPFLTNSPITLPEISDRLGVRDDATGIEATFRLSDIKPSYSYAAHVAIVEIDLETLKISIPRYAVAHDCGTVINPLLVEGQIIGGVIQGLGGLLREHLRYDDAGRLLTSKLMDYVLPSANDSPPDFRVVHIETPSSFAPFNVRGVGEGGVTGCYGAIATAVADALASRGVKITGSGPYSPSFLLGLLANSQEPE